MSAGRAVRLLAAAILAALAAGAASAGSGRPADDWLDRVAREIRDSEYEITSQPRSVIPGHPGGLHAANRRQDLRAYFLADGVDLVRRTDPAPAAALRLALREAGAEGTLDPIAPSEPRASGRVVTYDRGGIVARWENTEHGLLLQVRIPWDRGEAAGRLAFDNREAAGWRSLDAAGGIEPLPAADGRAVAWHDGDGLVARLVLLRVLDGRGAESEARIEVGPGRLEVRFEGTPPAPEAGARPSPLRELLPLPQAEAAPDTGVIRVELLVEGAATEASFGPATTPDWSVAGAQSFAGFGGAVAGAGDVNGDGFDDLLVGADLYDNGSTDEGRAFLYLGSALGPAATAAWTFESNQAGAVLGGAVAAAGDVNGDGYADVIVGAGRHDGPGTDAGRALVFLGSPAGLQMAPVWDVRGAAAGDRFGAAVAGGGDVNGDGFDDVVLGAPFADASPTVTDAGRASLYLGGAAGPSPAAAWSAIGSESAAHFGQAVAIADDVHGDGHADLLVGAPDQGSPDRGRAYLFRGTPTGAGAPAEWTLDGFVSSGRFGAALAGAGDVDGDGFGDVVVGAPSAGTAYAFRGSAAGLGTVSSWSRSRPDNFGSALAGGQDVDGDGFADLLIGAPGGEGKAHLFLGSPAGVQTVEAWTFDGVQSFEALGGAVAAAGDVNGDGFGDLLVGSRGYDANTGRALLFFGGGRPPSSVTAIPGGRPDAAMGSSVAGAGDVNGDGFSDVILGAPQYDNGEPLEGRALVYLGGEAGLAPTPAWAIEGDRAGAFLGDAVDTAGDVNADGYDDVVVGASGSAFFGDLPGGMAALYLGSPSGPSTVPAWTLEEAQPDAALGHEVGPAGDVNGDGFADVLVTAYLHDGDQVDEGTAWIYLGSPQGLAAAPVWSAEGDQPGAWFGVSAGTAGDVNGDGVDDVIVGAALRDGAAVDEGSAFVYLGSTDGPRASPSWVTTGGEAGAALGFSVAAAGDVDGDGHGDVIIGALRHGQVDEGRAVIHLGSPSGLSLAPDWIADGDQLFGWLGSAVAGAGDVNADGFSDVLVGVRLYDVPGSVDNGQVRLYLGSSAGPGPAPSWSWNGGAEGAFLGISVSGAGDVDADGFADIVAGAAGLESATAGGASLFFFGNGDGGVARFRRQLLPDGAPLPRGGFVAEDGAFRIQATGCSPVGRLSLRLEWEVKPAGTGFDGSGTMTGPPRDVESGACAAFDEEAVAAVPGIGQHWRARVVSDHPRFRRSPWMSLPGIAPTATVLRTPGCLDLDADGFGRLGGAECPAGTLADCDDDDGTTFPGAPQICDGVANDCEDPDWPSPPPGEADADGDGSLVCAGDCDDADPAVGLGFPELCDARDNDCDGTADGFETSCGVGECARAGACVAGADDCQAGSPAPEACDGRDNDCDGVSDSFATACGLGECAEAGFCAGGADSCVPGSPAPEACDGLDNDCDGVIPAVEADLDGDDFRICQGDCDDGNPLLRPGAEERCDNVDNDCDGAVDGFPTACGVGDCSNSGTCIAGVDDCAPFPSAPEVCDGLDNDCNGVADAFTTACGVGGCRRLGFCANGVDSCIPGLPAPEACDGVDNDCDGAVPPGEADADGDGVRVCGGDCDDASPLRFPGNPEACDAIDNDCDGTADGFVTACGVGACTRAGLCQAGADSCTPGQPAAETCNRIDDDCNGVLPPDEVDSDLDGVSLCEGDCAPADGSTFPGAPEVNDGRDNQCPGEFGFGPVDEISGTTTFQDAATLCWPPQAGAQIYRVVRSGEPELSTGCAGTTTAATCHTDTAAPAAGGVFHYLVAPLAPLTGSLGWTSAGAERRPCANEADCTSGFDEDGDGFTDCADPDCWGLPGCPASLFELRDTDADDVPATALAQFFLTAPIGPTDYLRFSLSAVPGIPAYEWCSNAAAFFRDRYVELAPTTGEATSGASIWFRREGEGWSGPFSDLYKNFYGSRCRLVNAYTWCSAYGLAGRAPTVDPAGPVRCEATDALYGCVSGFTLTIAAGPDRMSACGF